MAHAASLVRAAERIAILTGAGISAESGVPTFRDALTGLWSRFRPEELATPEAYARDPTLVWSWYRWRRELVDRTEPNEGHRALATLARVHPHVTLVTQNVDGHHERAGTPDVIALHGDLGRVRCTHDAAHRAWTLDEPFPPRCERCDRPMRPDVVWFGESLPTIALGRAMNAAHDCDLFLSIGTSNLVHPAASLPWIAADKGATVLVVNPSDEGQQRGPNIHLLRGPAGTIIPRLVAHAFPDA